MSCSVTLGEELYLQLPPLFLLPFASLGCLTPAVSEASIVYCHRSSDLAEALAYACKAGKDQHGLEAERSK